MFLRFSSCNFLFRSATYTQIKMQKDTFMQANWKPSIYSSVMPENQSKISLWWQNHTMYTVNTKYETQEVAALVTGKKKKKHSQSLKAVTAMHMMNMYSALVNVSSSPSYINHKTDWSLVSPTHLFHKAFYFRSRGCRATGMRQLCFEFFHLRFRLEYNEWKKTEGWGGGRQSLGIGPLTVCLRSGVHRQQKHAYCSIINMCANAARDT